MPMKPLYSKLLGRLAGVVGGAIATFAVLAFVIYAMTHDRM